MQGAAQHQDEVSGRVARLHQRLQVRVRYTSLAFRLPPSALPLPVLEASRALLWHDLFWSLSNSI